MSESDPAAGRPRLGDLTPLANGKVDGKPAVRTLVQFRDLLRDFHEGELRAVAKVEGMSVVPHRDVWDAPSPFWIVDWVLETPVPEGSDVIKILEDKIQLATHRSVTLRRVLDVWVETDSFESMLAAAVTKWKSQVDGAPPGLHANGGATFKLAMETWGKTWTQKEARGRYDRAAAVTKIKAKVKLVDPDQTLFMLEQMTTTGMDSNTWTGLDLPKGTILASRWWMGRLIGAGTMDAINKYSLKSRVYLGPTSMTAQLTLLMSNMAQVRPGMLVYDPFVGTGSLIIGAAHYGAFVMGGDMDYRILHGKDGKNWKSNFEQYGLTERVVDVIRCDAARPPWVPGRDIWDAVVADPPYGIRAGARRVGPRKAEVKAHAELEAGDHVPQTVVYMVDELLVDLLMFCARSIRIGGRLVFWVPTTPSFTPDHIPRHPCLELVATALQSLGPRVGRMLVTMTKIRDPTPDDEVYVPEIGVLLADEESSIETQLAVAESVRVSGKRMTIHDAYRSMSLLDHDKSFGTNDGARGAADDAAMAAVKARADTGGEVLGKKRARRAKRAEARATELAEKIAKRNKSAEN